MLIDAVLISGSDSRRDAVGCLRKPPQARFGRSAVLAAAHRDPSAGSDEAEEPGSDSAPDDEQAHHQLGKDVADGIEALEAYFGENPDAMRELLGQFLEERRARLAAGSRGQQGGGAGQAVMQLPHLMGRRHHYTVVLKLQRRRAKPKPAQRRQ